MTASSIHVRIRFTSSGGKSSEDGNSSISKHHNFKTALRYAIWNASYSHIYHGGTYDWTYEIISVDERFYEGRKQKKRSVIVPKDVKSAVEKSVRHEQSRQAEEKYITKKSYEKMFKTAEPEQKAVVVRQRLSSEDIEIEGLKKERKKLLAMLGR